MKKIFCLFLFVPFMTQSFIDFSAIKAGKPSEVMDQIIEKIEPEVKKAAKKGFAAIAYFYNQLQNKVDKTRKDMEMWYELSQIESPHSDKIVDIVITTGKRQQIKAYCHQTSYPGKHNGNQGSKEEFAQCVIDQFMETLKESKAAGFLKKQYKNGLVTKDGRIPGYWDKFKKYLGFSI